MSNLRDGNWYYWPGYPFNHEDRRDDPDSLTRRACPVQPDDWVETLWFDSEGVPLFQKNRAGETAWLGVRKGAPDDPVFAFRVVEREPLSLEEMRVLLESVLFVDPTTIEGYEAHTKAGKALENGL